MYLFNRLSVVLCLILFCVPPIFAQTFRDATDLLQPSFPLPGREFQRSATAADFNNDGLVDIYHPNFTENGRLYLNRGEAGFVDILEEIVLEEGSNLWGAIFGDYDDDGYLDIIFEDLSAPSKFYQNNRNQTFTERNDEANLFVRRLAQGAAWGDFNLDGTLDLIVVNDDGSNQLFKNLGDGSFTDITTSANVETFGNSYGVGWGDINNDGYPDAFIATCHRTNPLRSIKHLLLNNRDETFTDINYAAGVADSLPSWGPIYLDYDNDNDLDIYVGNSHHPPRTAFNRLYRNNGDTTFTNAAFEAGVAGEMDENSYGVSAADFNNDGWVDIYVADLNHVDRLYRNNGDGTFTDVAAQAGISLNEHRAVTVADFNNDGWIDIFTVGFPDNRLLLNDGGNNHWLVISLRGTTSNYYGVGTRIELYTRGMRQIREINAGDSFCSQNHNLTAHFGLGEFAEIDSLILKWPSGTVDKLTDITEVDRYITIVEGGEIDSPPSTFRLLEPANDDTLHSFDQVAFRWEPTSDKESESLTYNFYLTGEDLTSEVAFDTTIRNVSETSLVLDRHVLKNNHSFRWSVDVTDGVLTRASTDAWKLTVSPLGALFNLQQTGLLADDSGPSFGGSWGDLDNDGRPDLFVTNVGNQKNFLYMNDAQGFTKIISGELVNEESTSVGSTLGDFDQDGFLDIFVANSGTQKNSLYRNNGAGSFARIVDGDIPNDEGSANSASWVDFNNDGYLDLFVANMGNQPNFLYRNQNGESFEKILEGLIVTDRHSSFGCAWADYDGDGDEDLFVANASNQDNALYRNDGDESFTKIASGAIVTDGGTSRGGSWADYDNDGDLDLFVTNFGNNFLYANRGDGTFSKVTEGPVVNDNADSRGALWGDFDLDGDLDLYVTNAGNNALYVNTGDGSFAELTQGDFVNDNSPSIGASGADYDKDGDLDLFVATLNSNESNVLLQNKRQGANWIRIKCIGRTSNTSALGTKVRVRTTVDGQPVWQMRHISGQTGFGAQSSLEQLFGLGTATFLDSLKVEWPSGQVQRFADLATNQYLEIREDSIATAITEPKHEIPEQFGLGQNYPNPFNPTTVITYQIPVNAHVQLRVFNLLGEPVRTLVNEARNAGTYSIQWDGIDERGEPAASGIYFYQLKAANFSQSKRMLLLR